MMTHPLEGIAHNCKRLQGGGQQKLIIYGCGKSSKLYCYMKKNQGKNSEYSFILINVFKIREGRKRERGKRKEERRKRKRNGKKGGRERKEGGEKKEGKDIYLHIHKISQKTSSPGSSNW